MARLACLTDRGHVHRAHSGSGSPAKRSPLPHDQVGKKPIRSRGASLSGELRFLLEPACNLVRSEYAEIMHKPQILLLCAGPQVQTYSGKKKGFAFLG